MTRIWLGLLVMPAHVLAMQCAVDPLERYTQLGGDADDKRIDVSADQSRASYKNASFLGDVSLQKGDKHLFSPRMAYKRDSNIATTHGDTIFADSELAVSGVDATYDLGREIVSIKDAQYFFNAGALAAIGGAQSAELSLNQRTSTLIAPTWSTCPREDKQQWSLKAQRIDIDHGAARGVARHATLRIKDVPIFYLPYFSFPVSDARATGFLIPTLRLSERNGLVLDIPYYWNIAPNQDATWHLRPMTKRGVMFAGEYRFLGEQQNGRINATMLAKDTHFNNRDRWSLRADYHYQFNEQWRADVLFQELSDKYYLDDFSNELALYNKWYLDRHATLSGNTPYGDWLFRVQDYDRMSDKVSAQSAPYTRLPQISYHYDWQENDWQSDIAVESVRFSKRHATEGWRNTLDASISYRWAREYGYLMPKLSLNAAYYSLRGHGLAADNKTVTRVLPTLSLDGKLVFERNLELFGKRWQQSLEPHLFYLYTPFKAQDDIPNFDSSLRSQSWGWLFARNRFTGSDRIGDANQLTTALTTRLVDGASGQERLSLSVGQIQYFADRRVHLPNKPIRDEGKSDLVIDGSFQPDRHWSLRSLSRWDMDKRQNRRSLIDVRYDLDGERFLGVSHRYAEDDYDVVSLYGSWRLKSKWRAFLRQDYSLRHNNTTNLFAGLEYNDCCWAWRLLGKRYRDDPTDPKMHNALYLEFVLKGLGRLGNGASSVLNNEIRGYQPLVDERSF